MKKFICILFILLAGLVGTAQAQVSAITITGAPGCGPTGQAVTINFTVTDAGGYYGAVGYDVIFSAATTADSTGWSSFLQSNMVCSNTDTGFYFYGNGNALLLVAEL